MNKMNYIKFYLDISKLSTNKCKLIPSNLSSLQVSVKPVTYNP